MVYKYQFFTILPQLETLVFGDEHLVALLHTEGLIPGIDVWQGTVYAPTTQ